MDNYIKPYINHEHPGFILKTELRSRGITQKNLATMIDMQPSHLSEIIRGKRCITEMIANKLERVFHIPASYWMRIQLDYDYGTKIQNQNERNEVEAKKILDEYDIIYDMKLLYKSLGIIKYNSVQKLDFCTHTLGFVSPAHQNKANQGYFHRSGKTGLDKRMISTWSVLAMYESSCLQNPSAIFDSAKCDDIAHDLSCIFNENRNTINRVARLLAENGIKFCIVPKVPHASIDGFSFYNNGIPSIVVTKRFNRIDNFAFAILHELGHLKYHLKKDSIGKVTVIDPDEESLTKEETEANEYARNVLIPESLWNTIPEVKLNPVDIQRKFTRWAKDNSINKWIVLGRISHETNIYMFKSDSSREIL